MKFATALVPVLALTAATAAQTAMTYQGRLKDNNQAVTGLYDLRFKLFDSATGGVPVGSTQCVDNVTVEDGLFTATIDFQQQFANSSPRFLEIDARADTGLGCGEGTGFVTLGPRQALTSTPRAMHARSAFSLAAPDGSPANALVVDNDGKIGIGTSTPTAPVQIVRQGPFLVLQDSNSAANQAGYLGFWNNIGTETGWVGFGTPGSPHMSMLNNRAGGNIALLPAANVGVGTTTPQSKLEVRGDIRLGNTGQFLAASGQENLRIVRGTVGGEGTIIQGTGFTVVRASTGTYNVTFSPPFAASPTITAISEYSGSRCYIQTDGVTSAVATLAIFNSIGQVLRDDAFHFIAVGPR